MALFNRMQAARILLATAALVLASSSGAAADLNCHGPSNVSNVEEFRYVWHLRGGISWIAGLVFPTSGVGQFKTTYPSTPDEHDINSTLLITAPGGKGGFYDYETQMDEAGQRTLVTYHGYLWGKKSRNERTVFDYVKRLAHIHKETPEKKWDRVEIMPAEPNLRDILTAIHYLR